MVFGLVFGTWWDVNKNVVEEGGIHFSNSGYGKFVVDRCSQFISFVLFGVDKVENV